MMEEAVRRCTCCDGTGRRGPGQCAFCAGRGLLIDLTGGNRELTDSEQALFSDVFEAQERRYRTVPEPEQ